MLREASNSNWILVSPWMLEEVVPTSPGKAENSFSSGVAMEVAMFSGLAPGNFASTSMVGVS